MSFACNISQDTMQACLCLVCKTLDCHLQQFNNKHVHQYITDKASCCTMCPIPSHLVQNNSRIRQNQHAFPRCLLFVSLFLLLGFLGREALLVECSSSSSLTSLARGQALTPELGLLGLDCPHCILGFFCFLQTHSHREISTAAVVS